MSRKRKVRIQLTYAVISLAEDNQLGSHHQQSILVRAHQEMVPDWDSGLSVQPMHCYITKIEGLSDKEFSSLFISMTLSYSSILPDHVSQLLSFLKSTDSS
jgi:hypothetical protein